MLALSQFQTPFRCQAWPETQNRRNVEVDVPYYFPQRKPNGWEPNIWFRSARVWAHNPIKTKPLPSYQHTPSSTPPDLIQQPCVPFFSALCAFPVVRHDGGVWGTWFCGAECTPQLLNRWPVRYSYSPYSLQSIVKCPFLSQQIQCPESTTPRCAGFGECSAPYDRLRGFCNLTLSIARFLQLNKVQGFCNFAIARFLQLVHLRYCAVFAITQIARFLQFDIRNCAFLAIFLGKYVQRPLNWLPVGASNRNVFVD